MRGPAVILTSTVLVATLLFPGVAIAKGGNGDHAVAKEHTPGNAKASDDGKAKSDKGANAATKPQASDNGKAKSDKGANAATKPQASDNGKAKSDKGANAATNPQASDNGQVKPEDGPDADADLDAQPGTSLGPGVADPQYVRTGESPQSSRYRALRAERIDRIEAGTRREQQEARSSGEEAPVSVVSPDPMIAEDSADSALGADGAETRGVLDTIWIGARASLDRMRGGLTEVWSTVISWFGG